MRDKTYEAWGQVSTSAERLDELAYRASLVVAQYADGLTGDDLTLFRGFLMNYVLPEVDA